MSTADARQGPVDVGVVGMGFGTDFLPIYQSHPEVGRVAVCDADPARLDAIGHRYGIDERFTDLDEMLAVADVDAVHLLTPVHLHHQQSLRVLDAGKHCACAVPMARTLTELTELVEAERRSGRNYMMMETAVYAREYFLVEDLLRSGQLGELTYLTGVHHQDLDGFPPYWWGFPPMLYATHALSPLLALSQRRAARVRCSGSGRLPAFSRRDYDNPYPLETATVDLEGDEPLVATATVSFSALARTYNEGFSVYGTRMGFEWPQAVGDDPLVFELGPSQQGRRGGSTGEHRVACPDRTAQLPPEIARFTSSGAYDPGTGAPVQVESHHGGSHPHLVHEFISSIVEQRPARIDATTAATWCAPGICAHASAMSGGAPVTVPRFGSAASQI